MIGAAFITLTASAWPQELDHLDRGRIAFVANCAACHGADGKGTGPHGAALRPKPADLTTLAERNNGVFSAAAIYDAIDGRAAARIHPRSEMPIWGCRHPPRTRRLFGKRGRAKRRILGNETHSSTLETLLDLPCDPKSVVEDRLWSIVEYLRRIQVK